MTKEDRELVANEAMQLSSINEYSYDKYVEFVKMLVENHPHSYFSIIKGLRFSVLWKDICEKTSFINKHFAPNAATRIFYYINKLSELKKCETCGKFFAKNIPAPGFDHYFCCNRCAQLHESTIAKTKATKLKNHGDPNWNNMEKNKATCMEHYGVKYSWQAKEVKEKCKQSIRDRYGVDHQMKSQKVKDEMKSRYKEKHGVEHPFQDPNVQAKIKAKNQANLGVDYPMQNKELHKVMHEHSALTQTANFFNNKLSKDPQYEALFTLDEWLANNSHNTTHEFSWRCKKCGKTFKSRVMWGAATYVRCYDCYPVIKDTSQFEKDIADYIRSLGKFNVFNHTHETREVIPPKEVDIIVKDGSEKILLGIEADGLYWHSAANQHGCDYHLSKTDACMSKHIQLVHVFEDEWTLKQDIVKSRIASLLGVFSQRIYARECSIKVLSPSESKMFFNENHLQGSCNAKISLGLCYGEELVAAMSFGRRRLILNGKNEDGSWELLRFACKCGVKVVGGASKLLAHFEKLEHPKKLLSYADRRWSIGKLYEALGFKLDHVSKPNYWYLDSSFSKRIYRYAFSKHKQKSILPKFDNNLTELENMAANGYSWIWDCGNLVFVKNYSS